MINSNNLMGEEGGGENPGGGSGGMMGGPSGENPGGENPGSNPESQAPAWNYADGIAGEGDRPAWLLEKHKTVSQQAENYLALEKRFGSFTGSPDEYAAIEGFKEEGEAGIMLATIKEIGKEANMDQGTYEKIVKGIAQNIDGYRESMKQDEMNTAIKSIPNFETRREALATTAQAALTTDQFEGLNSLMSTTAGFEAVEALTMQIRGGTLPGQRPPAEARETRDITKEINALDPTDMAGRAKLLKEMSAANGGQGTMV